jgi:hypothetical protein
MIHAVVTVILSMKALPGGCLTPDLVKGYPHTLSAAFMSMFIAAENKLLTQ